MSKQAKIFELYMAMPRNRFQLLIIDYQTKPHLFSDEEKEVIEAILALAED